MMLLREWLWGSDDCCPDGAMVVVVVAMRDMSCGWLMYRVASPVLAYPPWCDPPCPAPTPPIVVIPIPPVLLTRLICCG